MQKKISNVKHKDQKNRQRRNKQVGNNNNLDNAEPAYAIRIMRADSEHACIPRKEMFPNNKHKSRNATITWEQTAIDSTDTEGRASPQYQVCANWTFPNAGRKSSISGGDISAQVRHKRAIGNYNSDAEEQTEFNAIKAKQLTRVQQRMHIDETGPLVQ